MLTVGVILVSIAGLIFATALWASMGGGGRTGIIGFAAFFFFAISAFSYKKLGLKDSSNAFFSLGSIFTVITYLTAGYYELFGTEFSFEGTHKWGFVAGASAVVSALSAYGYRLYKKKYLAVMSLSGGFAAYMFLAADIAGKDISVLSLLSSIGLSGCLAAVICMKGKPDWAADNLKVCAGISGFAAFLSPFVRHLGRWTAADFITVIILFAIISLYAFKRGSKPMLSLHSIYMLAVTASAVMQIFKGDDDELVLFSAAFFAFLCVGLIYRAFPVLRTPVSDNAFSGAMAVTLLLLADFSDNSILPFVCSLVFAGYMCIFALDRKPYSPIYAVLTPAVLAYAGASLDSYLSYVCEISTGIYVAIGLSFVYSAVALGLALLGKKEIKPDIRFISGAFAAAAAVCTFALTDVSKEFTGQRVFALAAGIFALYAVFRSKLQPLSAVPAFMCSVYVMYCGESLAADSLYAGKLIGVLMAYAAFAALSKIFFPKTVGSYVPKPLTPEEQAMFAQQYPNGRLPLSRMTFRIDAFVFGAASAVIQLFGISFDYVLYTAKSVVSIGRSAPEPIEYAVPLLAWVCLTALLIMLIRENNPHSANTVFAAGGSLASMGVSYMLINLISKFIDTRAVVGVLVASVIVFVCLCILSRVIFSETLFVKGKNGGVPDFFAVSAGAALYRLYILTTNGSGNSLHQTALFIFWLAAGVFAFVLIRKKNDANINTVFKLISSGALLVAFIERPFLVSDTQTIEMKVTVIAIAVFGFAAKYILRNNETAAENFATAVHVFAMILLIGDALVNQSLANTLIVMSVAAGVMIVSFIIKRKRWFLISACMLVGLTIYICKDFLASISWWVYLLVIGITLITIAVSNEYLKNKSEREGTAQQKRGRLFEEWKW